MELSNLKTVKSFAQETLESLGQDPIDYLVLNAAMARKADDRPGPHGSQWSDSYVVNHLCASSATRSLFLLDTDAISSPALSDAPASTEARGISVSSRRSLLRCNPGRDRHL